MEITRANGGHEQKNIRRRVYDALNVLMAIDVIRKDKKEIRWVGFPEDIGHQSSVRLQSEQLALARRVADKRRAFNELVQRFVCLKSLISRNSKLDAAGRVSSSGNPMNSFHSVSNGKDHRSSSNSSNLLISPPTDRLYLPFVLVNASKDCRVHCEMLEDRYTPPPPFNATLTLFPPGTIYI